MMKSVLEQGLSLDERPDVPWPSPASKRSPLPPRQAGLLPRQDPANTRSIEGPKEESCFSVSF